MKLCTLTAKKTDLAVLRVFLYTDINVFFHLHKWAEIYLVLRLSYRHAMARYHLSMATTTRIEHHDGSGRNERC